MFESSMVWMDAVGDVLVSVEKAPGWSVITLTTLAKPMAAF